MSGKKRYTCMSEFMVVWYLSHICEASLCLARASVAICESRKFCQRAFIFSKFDEGVRIPIPLKVGHHLNGVPMMAQH